MSVPAAHSPDTSSRRRRQAEQTQDPLWEHDHHHRHEQMYDRLCGDSTGACASSSHHTSCAALITSCLSPHTCSSRNACEESWEDIQQKRTIRAENEVEANKLVNNYRFGFRKWKSHVTERSFQDRSDVVKELYSELNVIKPHSGRLITCGNVTYVLLFGWWVSLAYYLVGILMFITVIGVPYGKLCWKLACYFLWPFSKSIHEHRFSTYVWLLLGYPPLVVIHFLVCFLSWILIFTIPVSKMNLRALCVILLLPPEDVFVSTCSQQKARENSETRALLCCYQATNWYYYKYTVDGINVFAVNLLPLVIVAIIIGYIDKENKYATSDVKFAIAICSIIPLSYYIGMGIASISAQSNFAVGAVVNATFGSITELTFYITALIRGHKAANPCLQEVVKAALTGTLLGCILFIPGICMIIGGLRHSEQRFNSRSAGVSSALLFISVGGVFAPTLFSKAYGNLVCDACTNSIGGNSTKYINCMPLVYTVSVLLPVAYIIGLIFTLKTHSHIYNIHCLAMICVCAVTSHHGAVVHWSRWRSLVILIVATVLMSACADLATEHIQPILNQPNISQYFIGVTVLAMVPEIPEIVNGIQFALQNNISLSLEVGSCIAVQVCMLQIPILVLFNVFYDVGFVLLFSDMHLWASIFGVILVNYIFMDGKSDYFQGTALVVVYFILLALYYFAPTPAGC
uniref:Putative cation exchanger C521.04c n=1 Tax=Mastacembelus armatus TaxID=205130 RepID=A0A7N8Y997_9TELE